MMWNKIPDFNRYGYLPKGIYKATVHEIKERFGKSSERREQLFENFLEVVTIVKKIRKTIDRFFLDGSFVTEKEHPGDIDCILIIKVGFDLDSDEATRLHNAKELFNCHMLIAEEGDRELIRKHINFFSHDNDEKPKGLLEVLL